MGRWLEAGGARAPAQPLASRHGSVPFFASTRPRCSRASPGRRAPAARSSRSRSSRSPRASPSRTPRPRPTRAARRATRATPTTPSRTVRPSAAPAFGPRVRSPRSVPAFGPRVWSPRAVPAPRPRALDASRFARPPRPRRANRIVRLNVHPLPDPDPDASSPTLSRPSTRTRTRTQWARTSPLDRPARPLRTASACPFPTARTSSRPRRTRLPATAAAPLSSARRAAR